MLPGSAGSSLAGVPMKNTRSPAESPVKTPLAVVMASPPIAPLRPVATPVVGSMLTTSRLPPGAMNRAYNTALGSSYQTPMVLDVVSVDTGGVATLALRAIRLTSVPSSRLTV